MHKDHNPAAAPTTALSGGSLSADLDAFWMPFTASRQFKSAPRLLARAKDMHYWTPEGRQVLDAVAGLWCVNAGHARPKIVAAIAAQAAEMDFAPPFNMAHPKSFELAEKLVAITPKGLDKVFYTNSGSEAVDTALKMAVAYHRARGEGQRTRLIGRERGYHGVNFGGSSTPVEPATGSTITAAIVDASCSATIRSRSSASSAPCSGMPRENAFFCRSWVWRRWSTPPTMVPKLLRLPAMPPTEMPPKLTPW